MYTVYTTLLRCIYLVYLKHKSEKIPSCHTTSDVYKAMMYTLSLVLAFMDTLMYTLCLRYHVKDSDIHIFCIQWWLLNQNVTWHGEGCVLSVFRAINFPSIIRTVCVNFLPEKSFWPTSVVKSAGLHIPKRQSVFSRTSIRAHKSNQRPQHVFRRSFCQ